MKINEPLNDADLPKELRDAIAQVQPGTLRDEFFAQWLNERVSAISVKLEVN